MPRPSNNLNRRIFEARTTAAGLNPVGLYYRIDPLGGLIDSYSFSPLRPPVIWSLMRLENSADSSIGSIDPLIEELTHSPQHLVEFRGLHLSNRGKNEVVFKCEKSLRTNEARLTDFAAFTIAFIQWDGERIPVRSDRDLA
jgi:hypothetical protein